MANFGGMQITNLGRALQAKAQAGVSLVFTRIRIGSGSLSGQQIAELTNLITPQMWLTLNKSIPASSGKYTVGASLSNVAIVAGFYFREMGVYATDPDVGEILYCYGNVGTGAEYIPAGGGADIVEKQIDIITIIGNASNVSADIDESLVFATLFDLNEHKSKTELDHPDGSVTDAKVGDRTITDATAPTGNAGKLTSLLGWLAYMIKSITGKSNWRTAPATTLEAAKTHMDDTVKHITDMERTIWDAKETPTGAQAKANAAQVAAINAASADATSKANAVQTNLTTHDNNTTKHITAAERTSWNAKQSALGFTPENVANKNVAGGYPGLDNGAKLPSSILPDSILGQVKYIGTWNATTNIPVLPSATTSQGWYYVVAVSGTYSGINFAVGDWAISNGSAWEKVDNTDAVPTVFGRMGPIVAAPGDYNADQITETSAKKIMTDAERNKLNGIAAGANNYTHPTGAGNNHIPAGGAAGQYLKYSAAGVAAWVAPTKSDVGLGNVDNAKQATKTEFDAHALSVASQLAEKAKQTDVIALEQNKAEKAVVNAMEVTKADVDYVNDLIESVSDGTPEAFADLTAIQAAYPSGDSHVKLNLADGYVYNWNGTSWAQGWAYQGASLADESVDFEKLQSDLRDGFIYESERVGFDISGVTPAAAAAPTGALYIDSKSKASRSGYIKSVNLYAKEIGTLKLFIGKISGNVFTKRVEVDVTLSQTGNVVIPVDDLLIKKDEYFGLCATSGNVLGFNSTLDPTTLYYYATTSGTFTTITVATATRQLYYNYELSAVSKANDIVYTKSESDGKYAPKILESINYKDKSVLFRAISDDVLSGLSYQNIKVGEDISGITSAAGGGVAGSIYVNTNAKTTKNGFITGINLFAKAAGTINFYIGKLVGNVFTPRSYFSIDVVIGKNKLLAGTHFNKLAIYENEYLGVYTSVGATIGYSAIPGNYYYRSIAEPFTSATLTNSTTNKLFYDYDVDVIADSKATIAQLQSDVATNTSDIATLKNNHPTFRKGTTLDEITNFSALPDNWNADEYWTLGASVVSSTANSVMYTNDIYGIDNRVIRWEFEFAEDGVVDFITNPSPQRLPYVGSAIRVSSLDNTINFMSSYTDTATLSILKSVATGFTLLNQRCAIEIEKDGRNIIIRLWQINGTGHVETSRMNTNLRTYEQGCLQGRPQVTLRSGAIKIYAHKHVAYGKNDCLIYFVGDSITEGRGVLDAEKYGRLLQEYYGNDEVMVSGIGGACFDEAYDRIVSETKNVTPKNVIINLGTNTAAAPYLQTIIDYFVSKGSRIFLCTLAVTAYNSLILGKPHNHIRIDLVMLQEDGSTVIPEYYPSDDLLHPNALGNQVMFNRIIQDVSTKIYD